MKYFQFLFSLAFLFSTTSLADELTPPQLSMTFLVLTQGTDSVFGKQVKWEIVRQFDLLCSSGKDCHLNILTMNTETCNGKTKPSSPVVDTPIFTQYYTEIKIDRPEEALEVRVAGPDKIRLKFKDSIIGVDNQTDELLVIHYKDDDPDGDMARDVTKERLKKGEITEKDAKEFYAGMDNNRTSYKQAVELSGTATGIETDFTNKGKETAKHATYKLLTKPMFCTIGLWPKIR